MIELPSLYDHQADVVNRIRETMKTHRRVILEAGTGVGKSRMAKWLIASCLNRQPGANQSGRACFAVHRRGLVDNIIGRMNETPELPHGVIMSQRETQCGCRAHVASIDTMNSWMADESGWRTDLTYDLFVIDECHSHFSKFQAAIELHDMKRAALGKHPAYVVGLSATPQFKGNSWFGAMVHGPKGQWLIDNGYSSKFRYMAGHKGRR